MCGGEIVFHLVGPKCLDWAHLDRDRERLCDSAYPTGELPGFVDFYDASGHALTREERSALARPLART
jgi:hypothetical protein